jgi:hypothetical protein
VDFVRRRRENRAPRPSRESEEKEIVAKTDVSETSLRDPGLLPHYLFSFEAAYSRGLLYSWVHK